MLTRGGGEVQGVLSICFELTLKYYDQTFQQTPWRGSTLISLIAEEVKINMEGMWRGCKSCKINKRGGSNKCGGWNFWEKTST